MTQFEVKTTRLKALLKILNNFNTQACFIFGSPKSLVYTIDSNAVEMVRMELDYKVFNSFTPDRDKWYYIDVKKLADILKIVDDPTVFIEVKENICTVVYGNIERKFSIQNASLFDHAKVSDSFNSINEDTNVLSMRVPKLKKILAGMETYGKIIFTVTSEKFKVTGQLDNDVGIEDVYDSLDFDNYFVFKDKIWMSCYNPRYILKFLKSIPSKALLNMSVCDKGPLMIKMSIDEPGVNAIKITYALAQIDGDYSEECEKVREHYTTDEPTEQEICEVSQDVKAIVLDREDVENLVKKRDVNDRDLW